MTTTTLTLAAFLEARLAEDHERSAFVQSQIEGRPAAYEPWRLSWHDEYDLLRIEPSRALAEVAAKRRLVELWSQWDALCSPDDWPEGDMSGAALADAGRWMLRVAAVVYSDHEDYDPSWAVS